MIAEVGQVVAEKTYELTRDSLVRYAGASGDFNAIHYRDDVAAEVGLPGVPSRAAGRGSCRVASRKPLQTLWVRPHF